MKIKAMWLRALDIAATLGLPPEKGHAREFPTYPPRAIFRIKLAFRLLGLSAKHCFETVQDLWWGLIFLAKWLKNVAKHLPRRLLFCVLELLDSLEFQQSQGQISHCGKDSFPQSDAKNTMPSSGENKPLQSVDNQRNKDANNLEKERI